MRRDNADITFREGKSDQRAVTIWSTTIEVTMSASNLRTPANAIAGNPPAFLDGRTKQLLIDGKWVAAASGQTFPSYNPSTGFELDPCALGAEEDVNRAVAAARR